MDNKIPDNLVMELAVKWSVRAQLALESDNVEAYQRLSSIARVFTDLIPQSAYGTYQRYEAYILHGIRY